LLCNSTEVDTVALGHRIVDALLASSSLQPAVAAITLDAKRVDALAGSFIDERNGLLMKLENVADRLNVAGGGELQALSQSQFRLKTATLEFDGVDAFDLQDGEGPAVRYRRAPSYSPSPAELAELAGTYVSDEAEATYVVTVEDGHLVITLRNRAARSISLAPAYPQAFSTPDNNIVSFRESTGAGHFELHLGLDRVWNLPFRRVLATSEPATPR
jgi:hypothetical protein